MQKVLGLPKLPTNLVYYKRQLSIFNEGIHCASTNIPYSFIWREGIAGRGAQEVGSCLKNFIDLHPKENIRELVLWSDSCGGQNRNIKIVLLLKKILEKCWVALQKIQLKYLESGHSFLINDTDFGLIERPLKQQVRIYTLNDFKSIIEDCKTNNKFVVQQMECNDFFSIEDIEKKITNRKLSVKSKKISWLKTKAIRLIKEKHFSIFFKYDHSEDNCFQEVDISKTTRGKKTNHPKFEDLKRLYPNGKPISSKKAADIKSLLRFIPTDAKVFYKVDAIKDFLDDIDGFSEDVDFEVEEDNLN
ncbi:uncharacterized protein LOC126745792 isoform X1 [Anthonomus grandis grandis]|uniref:uncharacterized protein LOC126745792 isoform X1 n=1 Tax=Anthonomus grandis grandis TaxID=2921223 RepID=UPI0021654B01|nr:uncharacterized protein LOC126745792 isoform X1 [Anthonomus grandis grandis]